MPDIAAATAALTGIAAAAQQGPGDTLRIVLLVSLVGGALLAWFLLRGYGGDETTDETTAETRSADTSARGASGDAEDANA
ncbi:MULTISPECIES: hypothetical protein [unclassified Streptomyces]|uniref:hypothetical protein n=1 Tax=unclassified Streptomyces TaxID=2593676 RepID=UPI0004C4F9DE|nr:hypothetical protein [Streptomyces sp. NRRL F-5727]